MKRTFVYILLIVHTICISAQTGVYYYVPESMEYTNSKVIDLIELPEGSMVLLDRVSDEKYLNPSIQLIFLNKTGTIKKQPLIPFENLYELTKIIKLNEDEFKVFGNLSINKQYEPVQLSVNSSGQIISKEQEPQVFSTLNNDVIKKGEYFFILFTKSGKNEKYNITLNKVECKTQQVVWIKKISSEQNEEADKMMMLDNGSINILGKKYNDEMTEYVPIIYQIDENGNQLWKKGIELPSNFSSQSFTMTKSNEIIYVCGYTKNPTGFSETRIVKLSSTGDEIKYSILSDFSANGIITLQNQTYLAYGSRFFVDQKQVVTKAKYVIIDQGLNEIASKALDETDRPDRDFKQNIKTSSDFTICKQLSDGRLAIAGKIYMPLKTDGTKKQNVPLLLMTEENGNYKK